jgi:DNA-binding transcriptional ArsR family regulator
VDARLFRALSNPLRWRILDLVASQGEASPIGLARELDQPLATVSRHVRVLRDLDFLELTRAVPRRGAVEHFYRTRRLPFLTDADWEDLPVVLRRGVAALTFRRIFAVAAEAGGAGAFDEPKAQLGRMSLSLDGEGWRELSAALSDVLYRAERIQTASDERRSTSPADGETWSASELVVMHFARGDVSQEADHVRSRPPLPKRR